MQSILQNWQALSPQRRVMMIAAAMFSVLAAWGLTSLATKPSLALLYANLDNAAAGEVIAVLDQQGVEYEVRGSAIYAESARRDELRLSLAQQGLPSGSGVGYELLDSLSAFGTTSRMFDTAYVRAKEGELARTLVGANGIRAARVHITVPERGAFTAGSQASASVILTAAAGLTEGQARAIRHIVASAVEGLRPENVTIADSNGMLYPPEDTPDGAMARDESALKEKVERLLAARVGQGNVVVEVSVERNNDLETVTERKIDPESRVLMSTETTEQSNSEQGSATGGVTVASNLPAGETGSGGQSQSNSKETSERANYDISETQRLLERAPGTIRRLTVAVLVGGVRTVGADGTVTVNPREAAELTALEDLVKSAVGFDEARGDAVTLKSMDFEALTIEGTSAEVSFWAAQGSVITDFAKLAILAATALVLALLVVRPLTRSAALPLPPPPPPQLEISNESSSLAAVGSAAPPALEGPTGGMPDLALPAAGTVDFSNFLGGGSTAEPDTPADRLRSLVEQRRDETFALLRSWTEDDKVAES